MSQTMDATGLLRSLGSGIRPGVDATQATGPRVIEGQNFQQLLESVREGELPLDAPVSVARNSGVTLTDAQLKRLAQGIDRATAAGANRAAVLIDGMTLQVDVAQRMVTGAIDLSAPGRARVVGGLDAVIVIPPDGSAAPGAGPRADAHEASGDAGLSLLRSLSGQGRLSAQSIG